MKKRLLTSLRQQLIHEIFFVSSVSMIYWDKENELEIIDFKYKNMSHQLVLNGDLRLKTEQKEMKISSYQDLVQGLLQLNA